MGKSFALSIRSRRTELGLTQPALARLIGVSVRTIKAWEAGESQPGIDAAARLAAALHVTLDELAA